MQNLLRHKTAENISGCYQTFTEELFKKDEVFLRYHDAATYPHPVSKAGGLISEK
jgi:hypothetical protein